MNVLVVRGFPNPRLHRERRGEKWWKGSTQCPPNTMPSLKSPEKNVIFMDHQKMEPPNSAVPKLAETPPTVALTRALSSQGGGGGGWHKGGGAQGGGGWHKGGGGVTRFPSARPAPQAQRAMRVDGRGKGKGV